MRCSLSRVTPKRPSGRTSSIAPSIVMSSSFAKQPSLRTKIIRADAFRSGANLDEMELVPTPCFSAVGGNQHPSQTTSGNFHITACKKITIARHWNYEKCSRRCRRHLAVSIPTIEPRNGLSTPQQLCERAKADNAPQLRCSRATQTNA